MTCSDVRAALSISFVPGGIDARSLLGVEEHVAGCDGCRAEKLELLRCLVALEMDRAGGPDLVAQIAARMDEPVPRTRRWSRALAAAAVLVSGVGLIWALRVGDEGRAPSTAGARPLAPTGPSWRAAAREDRLLLANGHELRLDRRVALLEDIPAEDPPGDWGDRIVEDRGETLGLKTGLAMPQLVPPSRDRGEDEQVFPFDIEGQR